MLTATRNFWFEFSLKNPRWTKGSEAQSLPPGKRVGKASPSLWKGAVNQRVSHHETAKEPAPPALRGEAALFLIRTAGSKVHPCWVRSPRTPDDVCASGSLSRLTPGSCPAVTRECCVTSVSSRPCRGENNTLPPKVAVGINRPNGAKPLLPALIVNAR